MKVEARLAQLTGGTHEPCLQKAYDEIISTQVLSETVLKNFLTLLKPSADITSIPSVNHQIATRAVGQAKALSEIGGGMPKGGFKKGMRPQGQGNYYKNNTDGGNFKRDNNVGGYGRGRRDGEEGGFDRRQRGERGDYYEKRREYNKDGPITEEWRQAEDEMVLELKKKAQENLKVAQSKKDNSQTVRLWLN